MDIEKYATAKTASRKMSVIIPTLNGGERFKEMLSALANQSIVPDEILIIDSSSSDDTFDTARPHVSSITTIKRSEFDHGGTRTMAGKMALGDILVYMTQDAVAADSDSLKKLIAPFADPKVAATYGRQLPFPDANCFARHLRMFNYPDRSVVRCWEDRKKYGFKTAFISNSFAAYRKELLETVGFFEDGLLFGEDTFTVAKLVSKGYCVAYAADAGVYHSHNYSVRQDFRRYFDIGVFHVDHAQLLEQFGTPLGEGKRFVRSELRQLVRDREYIKLPESILRTMMKFLSYNLGKNYSVLPRRLAVWCSLNRQWWS